MYSQYIIDGILQQFTPAEILGDCLTGQEAGKAVSDGKEHNPIVDESTDPDPSTYDFQSLKAQDYLEKTCELAELPRAFPMAYSGPFTMSRMAKALLDTIWKKGHFRLSDLTLSAKWKWNPKPLGNMASFYSSVEAVAEFLGSLGICLSGFSFSRSEGESSVQFKVGASERMECLEDEPDDIVPDDIIDLPGDAPFGSEHPVVRKSRALPDTLVDDPESWLVYIPFDSCDFRLGHSLLCEALGQNGDTFPNLGDGDYFIDCYEIVREFVEDGVALSGITVSDGGLLTALKKMCRNGVGVTVSINGILNAYGEKDSARVLFSEVPGALIQIKDIDYDYADAEFLLQDIAYYPIGHPTAGAGEIKIKADCSNGITDILQSLLSNQAPEGED